MRNKAPNNIIQLKTNTRGSYARLRERAELDAQLKGAHAAVEVLNEVVALVSDGGDGSAPRFGPDEGVVNATCSFKDAAADLLSRLESHIEAEETEYHQNTHPVGLDFDGIPF
ncbi:MAG: hypothetical protein PHY16_16540 [Methylobacter sp.]|nr:hypothetical protein [Methylobacter sp.]